MPSILPSTKLNKLTIKAFKDRALSRAAPPATFEAPINPESIKEDFKYCFRTTPTVNGGEQMRRYSSSKPQKRSFTFLLDGTGALGIDKLGTGYVIGRLKLFHQVTMELLTDSNTNSYPPFLRLSWGALSFPCLLSEASIDYQMFAPDGDPLRAEIKATFEELTIAGGKNPSMLSQLTPSGMPSLPALAQSIYGAAGMAAALAKFNGLTSMRSVPAGTTVQTPPSDTLKKGG